MGEKEKVRIAVSTIGGVVHSGWAEIPRAESAEKTGLIKKKESNHVFWKKRTLDRTEYGLRASSDSQTVKRRGARKDASSM